MSAIKMIPIMLQYNLSYPSILPCNHTEGLSARRCGRVSGKSLVRNAYLEFAGTLEVM
jgi:hypothetical protein